MDEKLQRLSEDLGRALVDAIADSEAVGETVDRLREEGYTLSLQLNCRNDTREPETLADGGHDSRGEDPSFRIDRQDLSFLQSIGIDPTRRRPRRR